ncbi:hypothetical protein CBL_06866 [Carabus blaptoides fortunei]
MFTPPSITSNAVANSVTLKPQTEDVHSADIFSSSSVIRWPGVFLKCSRKTLTSTEKASEYPESRIPHRQTIKPTIELADYESGSPLFKKRKISHVDKRRQLQAQHKTANPSTSQWAAFCIVQLLVNNLVLDLVELVDALRRLTLLMSSVMKQLNVETVEKMQRKTCIQAKRRE